MAFNRIRPPQDEESVIALSTSFKRSSDEYSQDMSSLPSPNQTWSHSTCSVSKLNRALRDSSITAIETDILMGWYVPSATEEMKSSSRSLIDETNAPPSSPIPVRADDNDTERQPIMAHPPYNSSDLTFLNFKRMLGGKLSKHLKLDFKDYESVPLVLNHLINGTSRNCCNKDNIEFDGHLQRFNPGGKYTIYLNADILPGPGFRPSLDRLNIHADRFLSTCLKMIKDDYCHFAFSLGWKVDCRALLGYDSNDIQEMKNMILRHRLNDRCKGVVLAVNARVLAKNCSPFNASLFYEIPGLQLLIWTGTGEPPISARQIDVIKNYFDRNGYSNRVGYDCQIASTAVTGAFYDLAVHVVGLFWNVHRLVSHTVLSLRDQALTMTY